jgi:hypothetical protein
MALLVDSLAWHHFGDSPGCCVLLCMHIARWAAWLCVCASAVHLDLILSMAWLCSAETWAYPLNLIVC